MATFKLLSDPKNKPQLEIDIQPANKVRFRYASEKGSHGPIAGITSCRGKKTFPTVKLLNYDGNKEVIIGVSLCTKEKNKHVLELTGKKSLNGMIYEDVDRNYIATFSSLVIKSKKKEEVFRILMDRKLACSRGTNLTKSAFERQFENEVKKEAKEIMSSAILCFEAFFKGQKNEAISPKVFTEIIYNQKATVCNDLRICRMSRVAGSWKGGDEVILLCDKVQKENIKVIFFETVSDGEIIIWKDEAKFSPADVHYQYAITFKTPPYHTNIEREVSVCLCRNEDESAPVSFKYIADDESVPKRKRMYEDPCMEKSSIGIFQSMNCVTPSISSNETSMDNTEQGAPQCTENNSCFDIDESASFPPDFVDLLKDVDFTSCLNSGEWGEGECFADLPHPFDIEHNLTDNLQTDSGHHRDLIHNQCLGDIEFDMDKLSLFDKDGESSSGDDEKEAKVQYQKVCSGGKIEHHKKNTFISHAKILASYCNILSRRDKNENNILHFAINSNNMENINRILKISQISNLNLVNERNKFGQTPLHLAALQNNLHLVKLFLLNGGNANIHDGNGDNCYHIASKNDLGACLQDIFSYFKFPLNINAFNYEGLAPVHVAVQNNSKSCILKLIDAGANMNIREQKSGKSALHLAVEIQSPCIQTLLDAKLGSIDIDIEDFEGNTPLHLACANGFTNIVKHLLNAGADPTLDNYHVIQHKNMSENCGEKPEDLANNYPEILQLLKNSSSETSSSEKVEETLSALSDSDDYNTGNTEVLGTIIEEKLCLLLDPPSSDWKLLGMCIGMEDQHIKSIEENCTSPTKALLTCLQNQNRENFLNVIQNALEMAQLSAALKVIQERHSHT